MVNTKIQCADVSCPFYSFDDTMLKINCEGLTNSSTVTHRFKTKLQRQRYMYEFCCKDFKKCPWCKTLMESKYEDGD